MRAGVAAACAAAVLAGCATTPREMPAPEAGAPASREPRPGAYYKDDGPGPNPPANLAVIPDAVPKAEPLHRFANRPYQVFGKDYVPRTRVAPFKESGMASWYGRRYHGNATSTGEKYDMYAMTAAHPTLPIPSYARVTNLANGRSVVVRINDRGPFHSDRVIDLSYVAAWKLGYVVAGSARVEVASIVVAQESVSPEKIVSEKNEQKPQSEPMGVFLQLGAFSAREGAESFRARIYRELAWLSEAIHVVPGGPGFRLHLGPFRSQDDARSMADRIQAELNLRPLVVGK